MTNTQLLLLGLIALVLLVTPAHAFGAGNIASISRIEGHNWRHGDIEDMLKTVACLRGHKWTSMMIKRVYFGNWLRDYSQAVDVGTLKGVQADTIRVLVWVLAFMSFGYATQEFEVTNDRLGVYRPEEHIDNPKDYADNQDARHYDQRLRGPVMPDELAVDPESGMKNYIANERGGWATSLGYVKYSFARSIHFGRVYTHGAQKGREEDLCEALRCLGQGLHCLEDFGAHTNYVELALREMGFHNVFPHVGEATMINLRGRESVPPLVTGTFGGVDFLHSVLGEATDHVTQSEVEEMDAALTQASNSGSGSRGYVDPASQASSFTDLLSKVPGTSGLVQEAISLQAASNAEADANTRAGDGNFSNTYDQGYGAQRVDKPAQGIPGTNIDPQAAIAKIYPILVFRDNVVRTISGIVSKIPGLEKLIDTISEKVTLFVMGLLAPYIKPIIAAASNSLKAGSGTVVDASAKQQYLVWTDPRSSDPTHSMLSKDHFSNILNEPAGSVAAAILQFAAPRVVYAWDHPDVPEHQVLDDISHVFHHPAIRDNNLEVHRNMFAVVEKWVQKQPERGARLNDILSSESVRAGRNHQVSKLQGFPSMPGTTSHSATAGGPLAMFQQQRDLNAAGQTAQQPYSATYEQPQPPQPFGDYSSYNQGSYQQPPPAAFAPNDSNAYPTAFQQGYEIPYDAQQQQQPPPGPPPFEGYNQPQWGEHHYYQPPQDGYEHEQQQGGYSYGPGYTQGYEQGYEGRQY